jgi:hypothetical protein
MTSRTLRSVAAALGAPVVLLACASSGSTAQGVEAGNDSPTDEASTGDTGSDAECMPISQACADGALPASGYECGTWSSAKQPATWCATNRPSQLAISTDCDGFDIVTLSGLDTSTFYYYDTQSGDLVGIEFRGSPYPGPRCIAGEAPGVPLTDCMDAGSLMSFFCESDGAVRD